MSEIFLRPSALSTRRCLSSGLMNESRNVENCNERTSIRAHVNGRVPKTRMSNLISPFSVFSIPAENMPTLPLSNVIHMNDCIGAKDNKTRHVPHFPSDGHQKKKQKSQDFP